MTDRLNHTSPDARPASADPRRNCGRVCTAAIGDLADGCAVVVAVVWCGQAVSIPLLIPPLPRLLMQGGCEPHRA